MLPSASTRPSCSTVTVRAIERTNSMSCSTTITEWRPASEVSSSAVRSVSCGVMPGDRLVHQQQPRVLHQQHADLQPLLLPVRQCAGTLVAPRSQADDLQHLIDLLPLRGAQCARTATRQTDLSPAIASSRFSNTV